MSKARIYLPDAEINESITIESKETLHKIKDVLSLKKSEKVYVFNGSGKEFVYEIGDISREQLLLINRSANRQENEIKMKIVLAIPLIQEQRLEYILEKATELGVDTFQPFICERSIRENPSLARLERWKRVVLEATRQSERLWTPEIKDILNFDELIQKDYKTKICAYIEGSYIKDIKIGDKENILLVVGPVGDFSPQEIDKMKNRNFCFIKLAENILRVETASVFLTGLVKYLLN